jgi:ABC-type multidrug transport system ATPase subunit
MLSLRNIVVSRGRRTILRSLSASADGGDVVALLGPNGAGKTTLLHFIAGILKSDSGDVYHRGRKIDTGSLDWRRALSYVLDDGGAIPLLTVEEQIYLLGVLAGVDPKESRKRTRYVVEVLDLERYLDFRGNELSSGLRKRLGIAIGIIRDAEVFLFDEPYSSLDVQGAAVFGQILKTLKDRGRIVVIASHSFPFPDNLFNRAWSISAGVVVDHSNAQEVRDRLAHPSRFGSLNERREVDIPWIL